uniref:Uncharacterized protein n=1 Tax=Arion vulgaris TaxID=1028688 RepID=A0A0B7AXS3_9EUPU
MKKGMLAIKTYPREVDKERDTSKKDIPKGSQRREVRLNVTSWLQVRVCEPSS